MSEVIEKHPRSIKSREVKKYSDLLKSQLIKARLSGARFEDLSQATVPVLIQSGVGALCTVQVCWYCLAWTQ
jgi:predicted nuclease with RNAse H fold